MAVGIAHLGVRQRHLFTQPVDGIGFDQHILGLRAIAAGIHNDGPADGAGHAAIEFKPGQPGLGRRLGDLGVERRGAGINRCAGARFDIGKGFAQPNDDAINATVAHQQVGADADRQDRDFRIEGFQECLKIGNVLGQEDDLGRPADAKPGERRQRRALHQAAAHRRQRVDPIARLRTHLSASS